MLMGLRLKIDDRGSASPILSLGGSPQTQDSMRVECCLFFGGENRGKHHQHPANKQDDRQSASNPILYFSDFHAIL